MSKFVAIGMMGYLIGMHHKQLSQKLCWNHMKKQAHRFMRMF